MLRGLSGLVGKYVVYLLMLDVLWRLRAALLHRQYCMLKKKRGQHHKPNPPKKNKDVKFICVVLIPFCTTTSQLCLFMKDEVQDLCQDVNDKFFVQSMPEQ